MPAAVSEPAWRIELYGPPLAVHDPRCWLDPRHHAETPCSWPALPRDQHQRGQIRMEWDYADGGKTGDLIPACVCCACGRPEPNHYWLSLRHGCCDPGRVRLPCQEGPRKLYAFRFAEEVDVNA